MIDGPAFYRKYDPGCGAGEAPSGGYWEQTRWVSNGRCVTGRGETKEAAESCAAKVQADAETFLLLPPKERAKVILSKYGPGDYPCMTDVGYLIRCFAEILKII
jgi:hypothetical protein